MHLKHYHVKLVGLIMIYKVIQMSSIQFSQLPGLAKFTKHGWEDLYYPWVLRKPHREIYKLGHSLATEMPSEFTKELCGVVNLGTNYVYNNPT